MKKQNKKFHFEKKFKYVLKFLELILENLRQLGLNCQLKETVGRLANFYLNREKKKIENLKKGNFFIIGFDRSRFDKVYITRIQFSAGKKEKIPIQSLF